jgi:uncharacterized protein (DUF1015 family)
MAGISMVGIYSFRGLCPEKSAAGRIPSVPYDVVSTEEACETIAENPDSFLRVIRSDAELPDLASNDPAVYRLARENLDDFIARGLLVPDEKPAVYAYRVKQGGNIYLGLVACVGTAAYEEERIRRHEHTRYDKEEDRTRHIGETNANTGLVVLLYQDPGEIFSRITALIQHGVPDLVHKTPQGVVHEVFRITDPAETDRLSALFAQVPSLYIADGHHRAKSAVRVAGERRAAGTLTPEAERFMAVLFAHDRVKIHGYSRLVADLGSYTPASFLEALGERFYIEPYGEIDDTVVCIPPLGEHSVPCHVMHMYLGGRWYELARPVADTADLIASLDVSVLQQVVMEGMLGITDPRGDPRLQYLGGSRPLADLQEAVDSGEFAVAFSMQPVKIETVLSIADAGGVMPPKSTWFEPKLLSGLVIHTLD